MTRSANATAILPRGKTLAQDEVQRLLARAESRGAALGEVLADLRRWSESIGYFDHLAEENVYLSFANEGYGVSFRLQVNYSRLGYTLPEGDRPACPLCIENIGTPGKEKLRVYQFDLGGRAYFCHLTPFPLHPGHFVVNCLEHSPMLIDQTALDDASAFLRRCPGWLAASNSDVEWAGASVLQHHHLQVFQGLRLPLQDARPLRSVRMGETLVEQLDWPGPVLRLSGATPRVLATGGTLLRRWKGTDPGRSTCNFLLHHPSHEESTLHLLLRHPRHRTGSDLRSIKSEGVGIIEMSGEVIVPPRGMMNRGENIAYFEQIGGQLVPRLIGDNSPCGRRVERYLGEVFGG